MKLGIKGTAFVALACASMAFVCDTRAQTTNDYLGDLRAEIELRAGDEEATKPEKAALNAAGNKLKRTGKTEAAQLRQLATAATILNKRFTNDSTLLAIENEAFDAYAADAEAQLAAAEAKVGTNSIPRGLAMQLAKARAALDAALDDTNGVPTQARLLAKAYNKMRIPLKQVEKRFPEPPPPPPPTFEAPEAIAFGKTFRLVQDAEHMPVMVDLWTHGGDPSMGTEFEYKHYHINNLPPEGEEGTWTYQKTGARTAVINMDADFPPNALNRTVMLEFTSATSGTFSMTIVHGDTVIPVSGQMSLLQYFEPAP